LGAAVLAVASPVSADPPVVGGDTTVTTTASAVPVTPGGDLIARPAPPSNVVPVVIAKAKVFTAHLWQKREIHRLRDKIAQYIQSAEQWTRVMGAAVRDIHSRRLASMGLSALRRDAVKWRKVAELTRIRAHHPPHLSDWMCIHSGIKDGRWSTSLDYLGGGHSVGSGEGSWTDSGGPYWGGLQMNLKFMESYGAQLYHTKGTADHWTPLEQIWTAVKAYASRGFWPWPNTARYCGLI
jgi:hypothetical protein